MPTLQQATQHISKFFRAYHTAVAVAVTVVVFTLQLTLAATVGHTTDEHIHVASGYLSLTRHDFRFDADHPPLTKYLYALPVIIAQPQLPPGDQALWDEAQPTAYDSWISSREWANRWFFDTPGNDGRLLTLLGRLGAVGMTSALVWLSYFFTRRWHSWQLGLLVQLFVATNPLILGHGYLANTDVPLALASLVALGAMVHHWHHRTLQSSLLLASAIAVAMVTKTSGIGLLIPAAVVHIATLRRSAIRPWLTQSILSLVTGYLLIWATYQFQSPYHPVNPSLYASAERASFWTPILNTYGPVVARILPIDYVKSLVFLVQNSVYGRTTFILEQGYPAGVWFYFPVGYLLKTPLLASLLFLIGGVAWLWKSVRAYLTRRQLPSAASLLIVATWAFFTISALRSKLNIGVRHFMVPALLLCFASAFAVYYLWKFTRTSPARIAVILITAGATIIPATLAYPYYLSYFDPLVVPANQAWKYLGDSNIDWGQQSRELASKISQRYPDSIVAVNWRWSPYQLQSEGLRIAAFNPLTPPSGIPIIVTATQLADDNYAFFRTVTPVLQTGNAAYVYFLP